MGKALLDFGFGNLNLHRIIAHCDAENAASYKLMEKIGMRQEGLLITTNHTNTASQRVCEKLGARLLRTARLPQWHDLYKEGRRF